MAMLERCMVVICIFQVSRSRDLKLICYHPQRSKGYGMCVCVEFKNRFHVLESSLKLISVIHN